MFKKVMKKVLKIATIISLAMGVSYADIDWSEFKLIIGTVAPVYGIQYADGSVSTTAVTMATLQSYLLNSSATLTYANVNSVSALAVGKLDNLPGVVVSSHAPTLVPYTVLWSTITEVGRLMVTKLDVSSATVIDFANRQVLSLQISTQTEHNVTMSSFTNVDVALLNYLKTSSGTVLDFVNRQVLSLQISTQTEHNVFMSTIAAIDAILVAGVVASSSTFDYINAYSTTTLGDAHSSFNIGNGSYGNGLFGIGFGQLTYWNYSYGVGIGYNASQNKDFGVGIGYNAQGNHGNGIGIGTNAGDNDDGAIGIGNGASTNGANGIGIGTGASGNGATAIGIGNGAASNTGIGIGNGTASNIGIGIGAGVTNTPSEAIAIGVSALKNGESSITLGYASQYNALNTINIGRALTYNRTNSITLGSGIYVGTNSVSVGYNVDRTSDNAVAVGIYAEADSSGSIAIGNTAWAHGQRSIVLGAHSIANGSDSMAIGNYITEEGSNTINLGLNSYSVIGSSAFFWNIQKTTESMQAEIDALDVGTEKRFWFTDEVCWCNDGYKIMVPTVPFTAESGITKSVGSSRVCISSWSYYWGSITTIPPGEWIFDTTYLCNAPRVRFWYEVYQGSGTGASFIGGSYLSNVVNNVRERQRVRMSTGAIATSQYYWSVALFAQESSPGTNPNFTMYVENPSNSNLVMPVNLSQVTATSVNGQVGDITGIATTAQLFASTNTAEAVKVMATTGSAKADSNASTIIDIQNGVATTTGCISIPVGGSMTWQDTSTGTGVGFVLGSTITVTEIQAYADTAPTALSYVSITDQNNVVVGSSISFSAGKIFTNILSSPTALSKGKRLKINCQAVDGTGLQFYLKYWKYVGQ